MAEAVAAISIVANIIQLVQFGDAILTRLEEYRSKVGELPDTFKHIGIQINALIFKLKETEKTADSWADSNEYKQALMPVVNACIDEIAALKEILNEALPKLGDSGTRRNVKAITSLRYDAKVENKAKIIKDHIMVLTYLGTSSTQQTTSPPPLSPGTNCHFNRDPCFVERAVLTEIISSQYPRLALVGLGGVGKTQIAIEYTHRVRVNSPDTWVFWVHAGSLASFSRDYREIADKMRIPGRAGNNADIFKLVYDWLGNEANGKWVMVIDNADDLSVFNAQPPNCSATPEEAVAKVINFVPNSQNGSILITSRDQGVAFELTGRSAQVLHVEPMNETEAIKLLETRLVETFSYSEKADLVRILEYMPLAISQAGSLISQKTPRLTIPRFIEDFNKGDEERTKLLEISLAEPGRDKDRTNSTIATWHITFQYVRKTKPSAARLLSLMCLFNRQGIPETLLIGKYRQNLVSTNVASAQRISWWKRRPHSRRKRQQTEKTEIYDDFEDDWQTLTNFSLIKTESNGHHFGMHRLVQLTTQKWLDLHNELRDWKDKYVVLMNANYPGSNNLLPHALAARSYRPVGGNALREWGFLMHKLADYATSQLALDTAFDLHYAAFGAFETTLGLHDPQTLLCMHEAACSLSSLGKYAESEKVQRGVLKARQAVLGPEHLDTLSSMDGLGDVLNKQKMFKEGHAMNLRALEIREKVYGIQTERTQQRMREIILDYSSIGKYQEAGAMILRKNATGNKKRAIIIDEEWCQHMIAYGNICQVRGRLEETEALLREVYDAQKSTPLKEIWSENCLGRSSYLLANVLKQQNKYAEAEKLYLQALEGYTKARGEDKGTLLIMGEYAFVLMRLGISEEAEELCRKTARGWERIVAEDDGDGTIITSMFSLAGLFYEQTLYNEALPLYQRALTAAEKFLGKDYKEDLKMFVEDYERCEEKLVSRDRGISTPVSPRDAVRVLPSSMQLSPTWI